MLRRIDINWQKMGRFIIIGGVLGFIFHYLTLPLSIYRDDLFESRKTYKVDESKSAEIEFSLKKVDVYNVKIKFFREVDFVPGFKVFCNGQPLEDGFRQIVKGNMVTTYFPTDPEFLKKDKNILRIQFDDYAPFDLDFILRNYRHYFVSGFGAIFYDGGGALNRRPPILHSVIGSILIIALLAVILGKIIPKLSKNRIDAETSQRAFRKGLYCIVLSVAPVVVFNLFSPYHLVISPSFFFCVSIAIIGIFGLRIMSLLVWFVFIGSIHKVASLPYSNVISVGRYILSRLSLSDKFLTAAILSLILCAMFKVFEGKNLYEFFGNAAYFTLLVSVVIKTSKYFSEKV